MRMGDAFMRFILNEEWAPLFFDVLGYNAKILCLGGKQNFQNTMWGKENYNPTYKPSIENVKDNQPFDAIWFIKDEDSLGPDGLSEIVRDSLPFLQAFGVLCIMIPCVKNKGETAENHRQRFLNPLHDEGLVCYQYAYFSDPKSQKLWLVLLLTSADSMIVTNNKWSRTLITFAIAYHNTAERTWPHSSEPIQLEGISVPAARVSAAIVNMAFACELGLKGLLGEAPNEHNLENLYRMLPVGERINVYLETKRKKAGRKPFSQLLHDSCNNYSQWRYVFTAEAPIQGPYCFLKAFSETLIESIGMEVYLEGYDPTVKE